MHEAWCSRIEMQRFHNLFRKEGAYVLASGCRYSHLCVHYDSGDCDQGGTTMNCPCSNITLSLTSEEARKLYNITCFVSRASRQGKLDSLVGNGTMQLNVKLQIALFSQGIEPDYDKEVQP